MAGVTASNSRSPLAMRIVLAVVLIVGVGLVAAATYEAAFANPMVLTATSFSSTRSALVPPTIPSPTNASSEPVTAVPKYWRCGTLLRPEADCRGALHRRASTAAWLVAVGLFLCFVGYLIWLSRRSGGAALAIALALMLVVGIGLAATALAVANWRIGHAGS
jgi:hypothetical protein